MTSKAEEDADLGRILSLIQSDLDRRDVRSYWPLLTALVAIGATIGAIARGVPDFSPLLNHLPHLLFAVSMGCLLYIGSQGVVSRIINTLQPRSVSISHPNYNELRLALAKGSSVYSSARIGQMMWSAAIVGACISWIISAIGTRSALILAGFLSFIVVVALDRIQANPAQAERISNDIRRLANSTIRSVSATRVAPYLRWLSRPSRALLKALPALALLFVIGTLATGVMHWWNQLQSAYSTETELDAINRLTGIFIGGFALGAVTITAAWALVADTTRALLSQLRVTIVEGRLTRTEATRLYLAIEVLRWDRSSAYRDLESLRAAIQVPEVTSAATQGDVTVTILKD